MYLSTRTWTPLVCPRPAYGTELYEYTMFAFPAESRWNTSVMDALKFQHSDRQLIFPNCHRSTQIPLLYDHIPFAFLEEVEAIPCLIFSNKYRHLASRTGPMVIESSNYLKNYFTFNFPLSSSSLGILAFPSPLSSVPPAVRKSCIPLPDGIEGASSSWRRCKSRPSLHHCHIRYCRHYHHCGGDKVRGPDLGH